MKSSIQKQLFFIITGLLSGTILVFLFINNLFLEKYYFLDTERKVHKMYEIINLAGREERLGEESTIEEIRNFSLRNNISTLVINENSEAVMFSAFNNGEELYRRLVGYVLGIHSQVTGENQFPETGQVFIYKDNYKNHHRFQNNV